MNKVEYQDEMQEVIEKAYLSTKTSLSEGSIVVCSSTCVLADYTCILGMPVYVTDSLGSYDYKIAVPSEELSEQKNLLKEIHENI